MENYAEFINGISFVVKLMLGSNNGCQRFQVHQCQ